jgi:hypothetical protein
MTVVKSVSARMILRQRPTRHAAERPAHVALSGLLGSQRTERTQRFDGAGAERREEEREEEELAAGERAFERAGVEDHADQAEDRERDAERHDPAADGRVVAREHADEPRRVLRDDQRGDERRHAKRRPGAGTRRRRAHARDGGPRDGREHERHHEAERLPVREHRDGDDQRGPPPRREPLRRRPGAHGEQDQRAAEQDVEAERRHQDAAGVVPPAMKRA